MSDNILDRTDAWLGGEWETGEDPTPHVRDLAAEVRRLRANVAKEKSRFVRLSELEKMRAKLAEVERERDGALERERIFFNAANDGIARAERAERERERAERLEGERDELRAALAGRGVVSAGDYEAAMEAYRSWQDNAHRAEAERDAARALADDQLDAYTDLHHTYVEVYDERNAARAALREVAKLLQYGTDHGYDDDGCQSTPLAIVRRALGEEP